MRICFLSSMHPVRDKRVFDKEARSLAAAGHEVIHLAPGAEVPCRVDGVTLLTYPRRKGLWGRILQLPKLYRLAARLAADCYHCNEVDSWLVGIALKLARRPLVVFDVHEHYPTTFSDGRFPGFMRPLAAAAIRLLFHALAPLTDRIVFAKRTVSADFPPAKGKYALIQNYAPLCVDRKQQDSAEDARNRHTADGVGKMVQAIHLGLFGRARGWPQLLDALAQLKDLDLTLNVVGTINDGSEADFQRRAGELGLSDRIRRESWMPFEEVWQRIRSADIGLVLFQPGIWNHVYASPHKMFDYMLAGLPVVAPRFAVEVAPIVETEDCGILIDPSRPDEIADALRRLARDPELRRRMGANGRRAVLRTYNWENEAATLARLYDELCVSRRRPKTILQSPAKSLVSEESRAA